MAVWRRWPRVQVECWWGGGVGVWCVAVVVPAVSGGGVAVAVAPTEGSWGVGGGEWVGMRAERGQWKGHVAQLLVGGVTNTIVGQQSGLGNSKWYLDL